ncbi:HAMP domain-containing histidine kinase [Paucibacter sp. DJ1R-11]|uniref:sensor histidine kinase n=1 Tax=Paucibacter sp. DJ1R-11 TaxID=2893556 RepID=UPI0021E4F85B|nr:HAMP domain-containing sensor histidine kinase [Paucibacter sp. DJ1R-11]MCV2363191.1 HAMP domain-containing histidine kinase [Paucibacter sp. DJ1R-11]
MTKMQQDRHNAAPDPFATAALAELARIDEHLDLGENQSAQALLQALREQPGLQAGELLRLQVRELRLNLNQELRLDQLDQVFDLVERAEQLGDPLTLAEALCCLARFQSRAHVITLALQSLGRAEVIYTTLQDEQGQNRCLMLVCKFLHDEAMHEEAIRRLEPWVLDEQRLAQLSPDDRYTLTISLAAAYSFVDRMAESTVLQERAYEDSKRRQIPSRMFRDAVNLANKRLWEGRLDATRAFLDEAEALLLDHEISDGQRSFLLQSQALYLWKMGRHEEAIARFHQARDNARRHAQWPILNRALMRRAECAEEAGLWAEALCARREQVELAETQLKTLKQSTGNSLMRMLGHVRTQAQNDYLRQHGNALERELAERNRQLQATLLNLQGEMQVRRQAETALQEARDALELKVEQRGRELEQAMRLLLEREKQAALGHLVAGVAHELNTPIGNALLATSTLSDGLLAHRQAFEENRLRRSDMNQLHAELEDGLGIARRSLARAADLVSRFKALALEQSSAQVIEFQPQQVIENTLAVMAPALRAEQVELDNRGRPGRLLRNDPGALGQVLAQLIENSLVHGFRNWPPPHRLTLTEAVQEGHYVLRIEDNGRGMATEHLARAFDPFFTTQLGQGSSGLGLHMVYRLVTLGLQGEISLHSAPGQGCRVTLSLPLRVDGSDQV